MRRIAFVCVLLLPACASIPGLASPRYTLAPKVNLDVHRGFAQMQTITPGGLVDNPPQTVEQLGQGGRDEDWSLVAKAGDGFSGFELEYRHIAVKDSTNGILVGDFGRVPTGTEANADLRVDHWRLAYFGEVLAHEIEVREEQTVQFQLGAGVALAHRDGDFEVAEDGNTGLLQTVHFADSGVPYFGLRGRVTYDQFSLQIDWLYNPDISFGGDFRGNLQDLEILARYELLDQDIRLLAGYRTMDLNAVGDEDGARFATDFAIEGFVLGVEFDF
ncbi:MAG: hypothetical protein AB7I19_15435 [Planctomycetota bacterium]